MMYQPTVENLQARPATPAPTLLSVKQFSNRHPAFTEGSLRQLIFASRPRRTSRGQLPGNGFEIALVRVGRRVLIDESRFFAWLDAQQRGLV